MEKSIRVLVANRPRLMREAILTTAAEQPDTEIVGEVAQGVRDFGEREENFAEFRGDRSPWRGQCR